MTKEQVNPRYLTQAEMLANRVKKRFQHFRKRFDRQNIEVFRLYDWDIPEIRAVVDWYAGHLVIGEYLRRQSTPEWLPLMGDAVAQALNIPSANVHLKKRRAGFQDGKRYERMDFTNEKIVVRERDLQFFVNPRDYIDTGLFADHRDTRMMVRKLAKGRKFLNLYCYTGSFSCYAAKGGAMTTLSVDRSETAIDWAKDNMRLNQIPDEGHHVIKADTFAFLKTAEKNKKTFDLAVVDPPSYSKTRMNDNAFDILTDHPKLIMRVAAIMEKGGIIFFSTNHQDFHLNTAAIDIKEIKDITAQTIPEDYVHKRKRIHQCWQLRV